MEKKMGGGVMGGSVELPSKGNKVGEMNWTMAVTRKR
jgi:hypothetical protein